MPKPNPMETPRDRRAWLERQLSGAEEGLASSQDDLKLATDKIEHSADTMPQVAYMLMLAQATLVAIEADYDEQKRKLTGAIQERSRLYDEVREEAERVRVLREKVRAFKKKSARTSVQE